ncbi:MAG TPA: exodeoxyribonuclease VII small subunit [Candidatus Limnocylindrales bacterium]|nr:exodeoxyribonuclease VII small subunit [Candidatus Limnocylindrales bacterium]
MFDELKDQPTYEEAVKRLEEIVRRLEDAEIPLEESLSFFQEGIALSRYCREKLAEIEFRVDFLLKEDQVKRGFGTNSKLAEDHDEGDHDEDEA